MGRLYYILTESCWSLFFLILEDQTLMELRMWEVLYSQKVRLSIISACMCGRQKEKKKENRKWELDSKLDFFISGFEF